MASILRGDRAHYLRMLDGLQGEGTAPPLVLWAISEEARAIARVRSLTDRGVPVSQAMREARIWGVRQKLLPQALRKLDQRKLLSALARAAEIDRMAKGLAEGDVWDSLLGLGLSLMPQS